jgi:preprotein translocase subunit SecB
MSDTQPVFNIEKIYVKDFSIEVPNSPQVFMEQTSPDITVQLHTVANPISEGIFEVVLTITVTAKTGEGDTEKAFFLVEVAEAGVFQVRNVPDEEMEPILSVACPNILFPYAREAISDGIVRAGFPPVILAPVNFEALYHQRMMEKENEPRIQLQ